MRILSLECKYCSTGLRWMLPARQVIIQSVQFSSVAQSGPTLWTPWIAARQASLSVINSWGPLKLMSIESVMASSHLILCHPLLLLPPVPPSIRVFSDESTLHMTWPKYWSFSFSTSPSSEYSVLISFMMDWLDLLAVQGALKSLLQHHSSKASIFWLSWCLFDQFPHFSDNNAQNLTKKLILLWYSN